MPGSLAPIPYHMCMHMHMHMHMYMHMHMFRPTSDTRIRAR